MFARKLKLKLGEILLQIAPLSSEQLKEVLVLQESLSPPRPIGEILVEKGYIKKEDVETALGIQQGYPYICVSHYKIDPKLMRKAPLDLMWKLNFIPLDLLGDVLTVAVASIAYKTTILEELKTYKVRIFISNHKEIQEILRSYSG